MGSSCSSSSCLSSLVESTRQLRSFAVRAESTISKSIQEEWRRSIATERDQQKAGVHVERKKERKKEGGKEGWYFQTSSRTNVSCFRQKNKRSCVPSLKKEKKKKDLL